MQTKKRFSFTNSIRSKLILMASLLLIIPLLITGIVSYQIAKGELNNKGEVILKNSVRQALQLIDIKQKEVTKGTVTLAEAQEEVKIYLLGVMNSEGKREINKNIDLGKSGYFVVYDDKGLEVAHPSLEGQNVWDVEDQYTWTLPNSDKFGEKISYQEKDPNWGWIVSAGSYMQDYNQGSFEILKLLGIILTSSIILGLIVIILFARHISVPIRIISENLEEVSKEY
ncbi:MAG: methyl-accepting chemotaxis sensory transducer [Clostridiales bacterium]|nr:methyl-accepting chemotaxis sensory transducer [Clostridiales bacterium]